MSREQLIELYRKAQIALAARDEVLGYVAHDIRNPLSAVSIAISLMARRPADVHTERRRPVAIDNIVNSLRRINRIVDDLLDVARLDCGTIVLDAVATEPKAAVDTVVAELSPVAAANRLVLRTFVQPDLPPVSCDVARIEQVIANLVGNALKFTAPGGHIEVRVERSGADMVRFSVADTGKGMTPDQMERVFDRFWQATPAARGAAGLGLAICRGIVEAHGGSIWVESEAGLGSTFFFTLTVASDGQA